MTTRSHTIYYEHGCNEVQPVQTLLKKRHTKRGGCEYLVQWAAQDVACTWEPEANITEDLIVAFRTGRYEWRTDTEDEALDSSSYPDEIISCRLSKQTANEQFKTAIEELRLSHGRVFYLDGPTGNTTRLLQDCIRYTKVPINTNRKIFHALTKLHLPNVTPFYGLLKDAIRTNSHPIVAIWFDYCCTFSGNTWCRPRSDFNLLLQMGNLRIGSVVAFTFSLRDRRMTHKHYKTKQSQRIIVSLRSSAYSHGIRMTCALNKVYWPSMLFVLFKIKSIS